MTFTTSTMTMGTSKNKVWNEIVRLITEDSEFKTDAAQLQQKCTESTASGNEEVDEWCLWGGVEELMAKYHLDNIGTEWTEVIKHYVRTGQVRGYSFRSQPEDYPDLVAIFDATPLVDSSEFDALPEHERDYVSEDFYLMISSRPIILAISPYASHRDIIDYVQTHYDKTIARLQQQYKDPNAKLGKTRKRDFAKIERNRIIADNQHLSIKELNELLASKKLPLVFDRNYANKLKKKGK